MNSRHILKKIRNVRREIRGSHAGDAESLSLPGCEAVTLDDYSFNIPEADTDTDTDRNAILISRTDRQFTSTNYTEDVLHKTVLVIQLANKLSAF